MGITGLTSALIAHKAFYGSLRADWSSIGRSRDQLSGTHTAAVTHKLSKKSGLTRAHKSFKLDLTDICERVIRNVEC